MTTEETPSDAESGTESNETYNLITQGIPDAFGFIVGKGYDILRSKAVWAGIIATSTLYATTSGISSHLNSGNINTKGIKSSVLEEVVLDENGKKTREKIKVSYVSIPHEQAETGYVDFDKNKGTSLAYDQTQREVKLNKEHEKAQETAENNYKDNQKRMTGGSKKADKAFGWDDKPTKPVKTKNKSNHNDHQRLNETDTRLYKSEGNKSK